MKKLNKKSFSLISLFLMLSMVIPFAAVPATTAHTPAWEIPSFAYIAAQPSPVGVGQQVQVYMWVDAPLTSASEANDIRRHDYTLTITKPDGIKETEQWPIIWDTTGVQFYSFTPDQVGDYTLLFEYKGQEYTWNTTYSTRTWAGDIFLADSATTTLVVQQEPLTPPILSYPIPSEYWTRPIEGQNTDWYSISSNWLNSPFNWVGDSGTQGAVSSCDTQGGYGRLQPDGIAPNSPHIMWTRPMQDGGVVGGDIYAVEGETYYMGGSYNVRFRDAIVMYGRLYFEQSWGNSGSGGDYICIDLRTGKELWRLDASTIASVGKPVTGYLYCYDMMNQHGVIPNGLLFTQNFARAYDPMTGRVLDLNITNVPRGIAAPGPQGEVLRYVYSSASQSLAQWNSSNVFVTQTSGTIDAGTAARYDWNKTLALSGTWTINRHIIPGNLLLMEQGNFGGPRNPQPGMNITAVSIKPETAGQILWTKFYSVAPNNETRKVMAIDEDSGVFVTQDKESLRLTGFSVIDGSQVWTVEPDDAKWDTMRSTSLVAYGNLYVSGFDGVLHCYDMKDGNLLWTYGNGGVGNSTYSGLETAWGHYPLFVDVIADGKVYLGSSEHSPDSPFYKGTQFRCINASTGEEIWTMMGWGTGMYVGQSDIVAEGFFIYLNCYDMQIYSVGRGPSAMTVTAPDVAVALGSSITIKGTVTDISAGTKQDEQAARFPNGVPAVSDASQSAWMEYVYMQKPRPMDTIGVPIVLSVVDSNGNYRDIGTTTSDANGFFSLNWMPDIEGAYTVYASFAGSESYWPSHAVTAFSVDSAPATPAPTEALVLSMTDAYFVPAVAGIIVAIAIVGIVLALLLIRKRP